MELVTNKTKDSSFRCLRVSLQRWPKNALPRLRNFRWVYRNALAIDKRFSKFEGLLRGQLLFWVGNLSHRAAYVHFALSIRPWLNLSASLAIRSSGLSCSDPPHGRISANAPRSAIGLLQQADLAYHHGA